MRRNLRSRSGERGIAMVTAIAMALIVSIMAAVVLNLTFRRFEMSAFRTQHAVGMAGSEAGFQYAFARLDRDQPFRTVVQGKAPGWYVVTCHPTASLDAQLVAQMGVPAAPDAVVPALHMGNKHVVVKIRYSRPGVDPPPRFAGRPYEVRAGSTFGTGGQ